MSTGTRTVRVGSDAWVNSAAASANYADTKRLGLKTGAGYAFLYLPRPFPLGAVIPVATLRVHTVGAWNATPTLSVRRAAGRLEVSRLNWNNQPGVVGPTATLTQASNADGHEWAFDVAPLLQPVADGAAWYGFRITTTDPALRFLHSFDALDFKPTLTVSWSVPPPPPTDLSPSGNSAVSLSRPMLRFTWPDDTEDGESSLAALQVQQNAANAWTAPSFDSGTVAATEPELDLAAFSYARTVSVTKTAGSATITYASGLITTADIGATITGTGIPAGATIVAVPTSTTATLSTGTGVTAGTVTATITRTAASLAVGSSLYWRARGQNTAGLWSEWSDPAQYNRDAKGTLTITNPAVAPNDFVKEWTPPITWTFTGETQTAYKVIVAPLDDPTTQLYNSGRIRGAATSHTLPKHVIRDGAYYRVTVRVWDDKDREETPGDKVYVEATRDFLFAEDATVGAVTSLVATPSALRPWMVLTWNRSTAPDYFVIRRDGKTVDTELLAADLLVSGTSYSYTDKDAGRGTAHTWEVQAVVNGKTSAGNPSATATTSAVGIWLADNDRDLQVLILNEDGSSWGMGETGETFTPIGATAAVRITSAIRGVEGNVAGLLVDIIGKTADEWADILLSIRARPGRVCTLHVGDEAFRVVPFNIVVAPTGGLRTTRTVAFDFIEVGRLDYDVRL